ncbi:DegT/DnrJ/EryC1/StrS family aminotransferase [Ferrovum sp.]|uniref:DegT/DnrJ/EryC1/StrS family aminotransferase n=1 Tax=Ferrovum sp. TaxID=2609467 RepID=UPI002618BA00|nr:DegT/DnrJ/EryC1/StrS family aminotransferase [Ferrovum sp.]
MITLSDPDISQLEIESVSEVLKSTRTSHGDKVEEFETAFAAFVDRKHAIAVHSGILGLMISLQAKGIGVGDEVIASPYAWHQISHALSHCGATPVFSEIDYWAGTLDPVKAAAKITSSTRALLVGNTNGHPAPWDEFTQLSRAHDLLLIEDSTEAIGSVYKGKQVGSFGDLAIFDFSQPGPLVCGEGGMIVTDDSQLCSAIRQIRNRRQDERFSVIAGARLPWGCVMSDVTAALGLVQLQRIDRILERRKKVEDYYYDHVRSFEGIKDPYIAQDVDEVHWFLYPIHLGTRFSKSSRDAIIHDLHTEGVESAAYCQPVHLQPYYQKSGYRKGNFLVTEKVADRVIVLPFHGHLTEDQVGFIVKTTKDASLNVGAGSAIY